MPPSISAVPVEASTMRAYVQSPLGYAMTGSEHSISLSSRYAPRISPLIGPDLYVESFLVALLRWCTDFWQNPVLVS